MTSKPASDSGSLEAQWGKPLQLYSCEQCGVSFLLPDDDDAQLCLNCLDAPLRPLEVAEGQPVSVYPPEGIVPFQVQPEALFQVQFPAFIRSIPYRPTDLNREHLLQRLQRLYLPLWWVDVELGGQWAAEVGVHYKVLSSRASYRHGWRMEEVQETKLRWEPRVGEIQRPYQNLRAPALDAPMLGKRLGNFDLRTIQPYTAQLLGDALVRLHERPPDDAWNDALMELQALVQQDVQRACEGAAIRDFRWKPSFSSQHWTKVLVPVYVTYYVGVDGLRHWLLINGQTGRMFGEQRSNFKQAMLTSAQFFTGAMLLFIVGALLSLFAGNPWQGLGALLVLLGLIAFLVTPYPLVQVWNLHQKSPSDSEAVS